MYYYLNSSLFEENEEVSVKTKGIDHFEGDIEIYTKTSLKGSNKKKKAGKLISFNIYLVHQFLRFLYKYFSP